MEDKEGKITKKGEGVNNNRGRREKGNKWKIKKKK